MTTLRHRCVPLAASGSKNHWSNRSLAHARHAQTATKSIANAGIATNTQGSIQSSGTLAIADPLAAQGDASKTLHITNTDGLIQADLPWPERRRPQL